MYKNSANIFDSSLTDLLGINEALSFVNPRNSQIDFGVFNNNFANTVSRFYDPNNRFIAESGTDDYAGDVSTTGVLILDGASVSGNLEMAGDDDWFALNITQPNTNISISALTTEINLTHDLGIALYGSTGSLIATNTISSDGFNNFGYQVPFAGTYYVSVFTGNGSTGNYDVSVQTFVDDYAGNTSTTGMIALDGTAAGYSDAGNDADWFSINITQNESIIAINALTHAYTGGSLMLNVFNSAGDEVSFVSTQNVLLNSGTYYIAVESSDYLGDYTLSADFLGIDPPGNGSTDYELVVDGPIVHGAIETPRDNDWYQVNAVAGERVFFSIRSTSNTNLQEGIALIGPDGRDFLKGGKSFSYLFDTNDTYYIAASANNINGTGTYELRANVGSSYNAILGSNADDTLIGTSANDYIIGRNGTNFLSGLAGDDLITGGQNNDYIKGGTGNDKLDGGPSARGSTDFYIFNSGDGIDVIVPEIRYGAYIVLYDIPNYTITEFSVDNWRITTDGSLTIRFEGPGNLQAVNDLILEGKKLTPNDDTYIGSSEIDFIDGQAGDDQIAGGDGDDYIEGAHGQDTIIGDAGNDVLFGNGGDDMLNGKADDDVLNGGGGNDMLIGDAGQDVLYGAVGNDKVYGSNDDDSVFGGNGNDELYGGQGNDKVYGGNGDDYISGGLGNDILVGNDDADSIFGGSGNDQLSGNRGDDILNGKGGDDILNGGANNDRLIGDLGADYLIGGSGNDELFGSGGNDVLDGEIGDDSLFGSRGDDIMNGGDGDDYLSGALGFDTIDGGMGNDTIFSGGSADIVSGGEGDDIANGGAGGDMISGDAGEDMLNGNAGNDIINGGTGNDILIGEGGNDTINGGQDDDVMTGGGASDTFVFVNRFGIDTITDFKNGVDMLDFTGNAFLNSFADITAKASQIGANVVIDNGPNNTLILENFDLADLDASDFIF